MDSRRGARGGVAAQSPRHRPQSRQVTCAAPRHRSDDWVVDNQILLHTAALGFAIGEISCRAQYAPGASAINVRRSVKYGLARSWAVSAFACGAGAGGAAGAPARAPPPAPGGDPPLL